jgi:hypothetical protein
VADDTSDPGFTSEPNEGMGIFDALLQEHMKEGFWNRFLPEGETKSEPLTRREQLRWWRKVEGPRRAKYAWQVLRRGYHEGEDIW